LPLGILAINKKSEKNPTIMNFLKRKKKVQALSSGRTRKACPQRNEKNNPVIRKSLQVNPVIRNY
jgi:hypothetical protein